MKLRNTRTTFTNSIKNSGNIVLVEYMLSYINTIRNENGTKMVAEEKAQLDYVAIASELAPIIKENSVRINEERQIPSEIAEDLADR